MNASDKSHRDVLGVLEQHTPLPLVLIRVVLTYSYPSIDNLPGYAALTSDAQIRVGEILHQLQSWTTDGGGLLKQVYSSDSTDHYARISFVAAAWKQMFHEDTCPVVIVSHYRFYPSAELRALRCTALTNAAPESAVIFSGYEEAFTKIIAAGARAHSWSLVLLDGVPLESSGELHDFQQQHAHLILALVESQTRVILWGKRGVGR